MLILDGCLPALHIHEPVVSSRCRGWSEEAAVGERVHDPMKTGACRAQFSLIPLQLLSAGYWGLREPGQRCDGLAPKLTLGFSRSICLPQRGWLQAHVAPACSDAPG